MLDTLRCPSNLKGSFTGTEVILEIRKRYTYVLFYVLPYYIIRDVYIYVYVYTYIYM